MCVAGHEDRRHQWRECVMHASTTEATLPQIEPCPIDRRRLLLRAAPFGVAVCAIIAQLGALGFLSAPQAEARGGGGGGSAAGGHGVGHGSPGSSGEGGEGSGGEGPGN